jgi:hypothetical protein
VNQPLTGRQYEAVSPIESSVRWPWPNALKILVAYVEPMTTAHMDAFVLGDLPLVFELHKTSDKGRRWVIPASEHGARSRTAPGERRESWLR